MNVLYESFCGSLSCRFLYAPSTNELEKDWQEGQSALEGRTEIVHGGHSIDGRMFYGSKMSEAPDES